MGSTGGATEGFVLDRPSREVDGSRIFSVRENSASDLTTGEACLYTRTCRRHAAALKTLATVAASDLDVAHQTVEPLGNRR